VGLLLLSAVAVSVGIGCLTFKVYPSLFPQPPHLQTGYFDITGVSEGVDRSCLSFLASGIALLLGWIPLWLYLNHKGTLAGMKKNAKVNHSVFGKLVRTERDTLLGFREFPHLREFGKPDEAYGGKPVIGYLDKKERKLVESWRTPSLELAAICRKSGVYSALREVGVFKMSIGVRNDGLPTPPQEAAYRQFADEEEKVCANVVDAMMRYYRFLRKVMPGLFNFMAPERRPNNPNVAEFARLCPLAAMCVCGGEAKGVSPLRLSWRPDWDEEHGLGAIVFQGQVIMIGADSGEFLADPKAFLKENGKYGWGKKQMTKNEKEALATFAGSYEPEPEEELEGVPLLDDAEIQRRQAELRAQLEVRKRARKQREANMQAARDKAIRLGMASAADVEKVLFHLPSEEFRLHFGEFGLKQGAFWKGLM
jgi:hypothetical protein